jgi:rare lipoprotein A
MSAAVRAAEGRRRWVAEAAVLALAGASLAACAGGPRPGPVAGTEGQPSSRYSGYKVGQPYQVRGVWYYPKEQPNYDEIGIASWYGAAFHNRYTADGEVFDMTVPSAAHTTLPLPSLVEVTNLANGRKLIVRVNDRGPFVDGRIIDLSKEAAAELGFVAAGITRVRVRYVGRAPDPGGMSARQQIASARKPAPPAASPSRGVELADTASPKRPLPYGRLVQMQSTQAAPAAAASVPRPDEYDYSSAPKRLNPYSQLARAPLTAAAETAAAPVSAAAYSTAGLAKASRAAAGPPLPDVDSLLAANAAALVTPAPAIPAAYELQAGTFATEDSARRFASGLTGGGLPEVQVVHDGAGIAYQVVVHGLAGPSEAAAARNEAIALGATRAQIIGGS